MGPVIAHNEAAQEFSAELSGCRAVLQYRQANGFMSIVHTRVPLEIRNRGVAAQLMRAALAAARAHGWQVEPACSYARAFMQQEIRSAAAADDAAHHSHLDALLDEALNESFPASDVPAIGGDH